MKQLVKYMTQQLVDKPKQVSVREVKGNRTFIFEIRVAKEDIGKVIGRQGRTAQALRTILSAVSAKEKKHMVLEIIE